MRDFPFQLGDVVQLKSGGPLMTVAPQAPNSSFPDIRCVWFDAETSPHSASFVWHMLRHVRTDPGQTMAENQQYIDDVLQGQ